MLFLDLDLDFFLNKNVYYSAYDGSRPGPEYHAWPIPKVRRFLEERCGLSKDAPLPGRTVTTHDGVLEFWCGLINSGSLKIPFDVVHVDAHPDLYVGDVLYLESEYIHIDIERSRETLKNKQVHAGNYLTFALVYGWINSLLWVHLNPPHKKEIRWDADARAGQLQIKQPADAENRVRGSPVSPDERSVNFKILPLNQFKTKVPFDYLALSKSPDFTPPESDRLISVIEGYMKQA
jgi:hypothetical protein